MSHNLVFLAGSEALAVVREQGLRPEMVKVVAGAAGGPKPPPTLPDFNAVATDKATAAGTFSSFALSQLGAGGVSQRIALATELTAKNTGKIYDEMGDGAEFE